MPKRNAPGGQKKTGRKPRAKPAKITTQTAEKPAAPGAIQWGTKDPEAMRRRYIDNKAASLKRQAELRAAAQECGPLPPIANPARRESAQQSLRVFLESYFPNVFSLRPWSAAHLRCIAKLETAILHGGQFALALPRGQGKTSLCTRAALWALLFGMKKFVLLVGANEQAAGELLDTITTEIEFNDLLLDDFPEVCHPFRKLEGQSRRTVGQTLDGKRTLMTLNAGEFVFPTVDGALSSGAVVQSAGILARLRGLQHIGADGKPRRPDLVILDDPQTDESANSPEGNQKRLHLLNGPILGLAGPGTKVSCICPCTVIRNGDMADILLNPELSPAWAGERHKLLPQMPSESAMQIWEGDYRAAWAHSLRTTGTIAEATEFYKAHRAEMDAGAVAGWEARYNPDEISAIQNAMNLYLRDKQSFFAEYQNEPLKDDAAERGNLRPEHIEAKITGREKGEIPDEAEHLILAIDIQQNFLPWLLLAVADDFTAHIVDYGAFPDQKKLYYRLEDANPTLATQYPGRAIESRTYQALDDLTQLIAGRDYTRQDGTGIAVSGIVIDTGWGRLTDVVLKWARETPFRSIAYAFKGAGIGPQNKALNEYRREPGLKIGLNWQLRPLAKHQRQKLLFADTYYWKSFLRERIFAPVGEPGALTIAGKVDQSQLIVDAFTSEFSTVVIGTRRVDKWTVKPNRGNNHLFDCCDMALVCASVLGCRIDAGNDEAPAAPAAEVAKPAPQIISARREKITGRENYPPQYAPRPNRERRPALSGTIGVKR